MKKQTVWILPNNDKAEAPVTWVDSANPKYTDSLKGSFFETEATILNDARTVEFDDDSFSDSDSGSNTKTIILDKLMDIKGCKTSTSFEDDKIVKKKMPHSYLFLKKPVPESSGNKYSETDELNSCTIQFTIKRTEGVMSDGGSKTPSQWKSDEDYYYAGNVFNRINIFFIDSNNQVILKEDKTPVAFYILLTKGHIGDVVNHGDTYFNDFSGCISDDNHIPGYKVSSVISGTDEYKYTRYSNLTGEDVSYIFDNNKNTVTLQALIRHTFPIGTKIVMSLSCAESTSAANSPSFATPDKVEEEFPFTVDYLLGNAHSSSYMGYTSYDGNFDSEIITSGEEGSEDFSAVIPEGDLLKNEFFEPSYFSPSVSIKFTNPNGDNSMSVPNSYPFDGDANTYYFPLIMYSTMMKNRNLNEFTEFNGRVISDSGLKTFNTPCWTFLGDIRRYTRGGKLCMKGTIRYLDYMADLQPEDSDYKDYKPFEVGI